MIPTVGEGGSDDQKGHTATLRNQRVYCVCNHCQRFRVASTRPTGRGREVYRCQLSTTPDRAIPVAHDALRQGFHRILDRCFNCCATSGDMCSGTARMQRYTTIYRCGTVRTVTCTLVLAESRRQSSVHPKSPGATSSGGWKQRTICQQV